ncbi:serpin (serine protease inhibitor) domain-containing protein [Phthorimaea operculella]|nr:serpin (serine protease inhibitor) domain-containing protein [Phthorimaea operculella]
MRAGGRVRCARASTSATIARLLSLCISIQIAATSEYGVPIEIKVWDTGRTPIAHMVDVTNGFGLKVLAEHNFLNDNNIAFSPYGLMGILVALYEGVDGESSYQIQRAMQLPWNRNVMRVGFRDIHRTLKTYFVPEEGFLAGLALNNENVTFNDGYKKILRFYGFDLDNNEQLPTLAPTNGTNETTTAAPTTASTTAPGTVSTAAPGTASTAAADTPTTMPATTREDPTANPSAETLSDVDIRGPTTSAPSSAPNSESTTPIMITASTEGTSAMTSQQTTEAQPTTVVTTTTTAPTAEETTPSPTSLAQTDTESIPPQTSSTLAMTEEPTANNEVETTSNMPSTAGSTADMSTDSTTGGETETTQTTESSAPAAMSETETTAADDVTTTVPNESTLETLERRKKSIVDFVYTNPPYVDDYLFHRSYDIPIPVAADPASQTFEGNKMFLANGLRNVQVTYMHYDTILEHAYLPHLEASALRLPLDSERYYLLVILPSRGGAPELGRLLARMARESDLSDVCSALRPRRVRAIVPSFTVKGHVTLTTDLQKLGIRDVFEPRQRDFTPMTHQGGVYVRSIEQAVSVAIRKYQATDSNTSGSEYTSYMKKFVRSVMVGCSNKASVRSIEQAVSVATRKYQATDSNTSGSEYTPYALHE